MHGPTTDPDDDVLIEAKEAPNLEGVSCLEHPTTPPGAFDSGVQLGADELISVRKEARSSVVTLEDRLRKETSTIVEELLTGWRGLAGR